MKTQDSIEQQIKQRLEGVQKSTDIPTWESVANSLKRRKRQKFFIWIGSTAGVLAVVSLLVFNNQKPAENNSPAVLDTEVKTQTTQAVDLKPQEKQESTTVVDKTTEEVPQANSATSTTPVTADSEEFDFTEGAQVESTFYYYDSKTGKQLSTNDKKVIDSILKAQKRAKKVDNTP